MEYYHLRKEEQNIALKELNKNKENLKQKNNKILNRKVTIKKFLIKKKLNSIKNVRFNFEIYFVIFQLILISFINFFQAFIESNKKNYLMKSFEVTLKISETGNVKILSDKFFNRYNQCEIYINNQTQNNINNEYEFYLTKNNINTVKIIWKIVSITNTESMFSDCNKIKEINLSKFDSSEVSIMSNMFSKCSSLISLDFSNFDTSKVTSMDGMFSECISLRSLNLFNFKNTMVFTMYNIFFGCKSLVSLNLSNFKTSNVHILASMFKNCSSLISLNLNDFDVSSVTVMDGMFSECSSLISLNLSNFKTSNVQIMSSMFNNCSSLKFLDLSGFDTSGVTVINGMFSGCSSLISLNLSNFDTSKISYMSSMFYKCKNLKFINLKRANTKSNTERKNIFSLASDYLIVCIDNDDDALISLLDGKIIINCNNKYSYLENINKCYMKNSTIYNKYICGICGENFLLNYKIQKNNDEIFIDCYEILKGFYFDLVENKYKACYNSCETCEIAGNEEINNCIECKEEYMYEINISNSNYKNCFYINNKNNQFKNNQTNIISNTIEELITDINITNLNNGKDKKIIVENKQITMNLS